MITLKNLSRSYITKTKYTVNALKNINLELPKKGFVSVVGRSGCGKTTFLNMLGALDKPTEGQVLIEGIHGQETLDVANATEQELDIYRNCFLGFVFQEYNLVDEWTVEENIKIVLEQQMWEGKSDEEIDRRVAEVLRYVELDGMGKRHIKELSGGQQQRVAIGRALVKTPSLLIADEPTGNLDLETGESIMAVLRKIADHCLVVMVTHSQAFAERYSDRIIYMRDGEIIDDKVNVPKTDTVERVLQQKRENVFGCPMTIRMLLGIAAKNVRVKRIRLVMFSVLLTLVIVMGKILLTFQTADYGKRVAEFLHTEKVEQLSVFQNVVYREGVYTEETEISNSKNIMKTLEEQFGQENCHLIVRDMYVTGDNQEKVFEGNIVVGGDVSSAFTLVGRRPESPKELVLSDYAIYFLGLPQDAVGENVWLNDVEMVISGIIVTDWEKQQVQGGGEGMYVDDYETVQKKRQIQEYEWPRMLVSESFIEYYAKEAKCLHIPAASPNAQMIGGALDERVRYNSVGQMSDSDLVCFGREPQTSGEIAVSLHFAQENMMVDVELNLIEYEYEFLQLHHENQKGVFSGYLDMSEFFPEVDVVGIILTEDENADVFVCDADYQKISEAFFTEYFGDGYEIRLTENSRRDGDIYNTLEDKEIEIDYYKMSYVHSADEDIFLVSRFFEVFLCLLLLLLLLLTILFFSFNVKDNQREIGILRALGVTERDVCRIYVLEAIVIGVVLEILTVVINLVFFVQYNARLRNAYQVASNVIYHNFGLEVCEFAVLILLLMASVYVPLVFMVQNRPVKLIRSIKK